MNKRRSVLALLALLCVAVPAAGQGVGTRASDHHQVLVPVDASGAPGTPRLASTVPGGAAALIEQQVAKLRFEPATRDNAPVASELSLSVQVTQNRQGGVPDYAVGRIRATPVVSQTPRYPAAALMGGLSAVLMLKIELGDQPGPGRMKAEVVDAKYQPAKASRLKDAYAQAALDMVAGCCELVESIDGQPLSMVAYLPAAFIAPSARGKIDVAAFREPWSGQSRTLPQGFTRARLLPATDAP